MLLSICQLIWKTQQWPQDWKRSVFIPIPKKGNAKECSNYCTIALISHASKCMLKILQARLQQYVNQELPDVFNTSCVLKGQRNQRSNCQHSLDHGANKGITEKHLFLFIDYAKTFDCVGHSKLQKILTEMGISEHLICLLRNVYAGQEVSFRNGHGTANCSK